MSYCPIQYIVHTVMCGVSIKLPTLTGVYHVYLLVTICLIELPTLTVWVITSSLDKL